MKMPIEMYSLLPNWMLECLADLGDQKAIAILTDRGMRKFFKVAR